MKQASVRVSDPWNICRFTAAIVGVASFAVCMFYAAAFFCSPDDSGSATSYFLAFICLALVILAVLALSARIGTTQLGMLIFEKKGVFVIPTDPTQFTLNENVLHARLFTSMFTMEVLPLSGLRKITREYGKKAFLHGTFGTRTVNWRNKRMRDECIAALQMATGRKLSSIDLGL